MEKSDKVTPEGAGTGKGDMPEIVRRKSDHVEICLRDEVLSERNLWDEVHLIHRALPEVDLDDVDTSVELFGKALGAPIVIASMTGGHAYGRKINENLAAAAAELRIPMGVGSQRPALEHPDQADSFEPLRDHDVPLVMANIGAPQLVDQHGGPALGVDDVRRAMDMVGADMVAVHLNYLQEVAQPSGDTRAAGVIGAIAELAREVPVIAKETGAGVSREVALMLKDAGVKGIDVGGAGGTSFSAVEAIRCEGRGLDRKARLGWTFRDWGVPTPVSVIEADVGLPIIATGGIRSGLDAARAIVLGADAAGLARRVLAAAIEGPEETLEELGLVVEELRTAMFLTGSPDIHELQAKDVVVDQGVLSYIDRLIEEE